MSTTRLALPRFSGLRLTTAALARFPARLISALAVSRSRHRLALLDDHLLRDIGLTREAADNEAARRIWDAPSHWAG